MQNYTKNLVEKTLLSLVPADKASEILASLKNSKKGKTGKKEKTENRKTLKTETIKLISEKPYTLLEVVEKLIEIFPEYNQKTNPEKYITLLNTTKRRLKGEEYPTIKITKDENGKYFTKSKIAGIKKPEKPKTIPAENENENEKYKNYEEADRFGLDEKIA